MIPFNESDWIVDSKDFKRNNNKPKIQTGFNTISFVTQKSTGRKCALYKTNEPLSNSDSKRSYDRARSILATVDHRAIVPFVGFYELNNFGNIITEEIEKGSLQSLLETLRKGNKDPLWDDTHKLIISYGIANAMKYLHERKIIHRDIKPDNILLNSELHPYLCDFSRVKETDNSNSINQTLSGSTPAYMAPEFINEPERYSNTLPIDVYSYGITLCEIITELAPYFHLKNAFQVLSAVISGARPAIPDSVPSHWKELIETCWDEHPDKRPTFARICEILESDEFVNDSIDRRAFEDYKELLQRSQSQSTTIVKPEPPKDLIQKLENSEQKVKSQENLINNLTKQLSSFQSAIDSSFQKMQDSQKKVKELEDKLKESDEELQESRKTIDGLEDELQNSKKTVSDSKSSSLTYNPFEELNGSTKDNYFIGEDESAYYKVVKKISEGATAIAFKVIDTRNDQVLCKKTLKVQNESNAFRNAQNAYKEFEAMCFVRHPGICQAIGMNIAEPIEGAEPNEEGETPTTISIYLEFLSRSLKECVDKKLLDNTLKARIVIDIVHALNFIHKHNMMHRDIKIENIMLNSAFEAKIVDFGLVRIDECFNGQDFVSNSLTKGIGTLAYMSPEMAGEEEYTNKTDVYSFGIVLHYIFVGRLPSYTMKDKMLGKKVPLPTASPQVSQLCVDLMSKCTDNNPEKRPSFQEILEHIRNSSYGLADEIDKGLVKRRDKELSFYESINA
ncbi:hypothetical protein M9Y10_027938 [Tritrichomonas musculus]|uniref:Protein kinase domain-containing protein n=2 Tax=Tritrichomonas musculus TaxID=1915356 RepID=A0ABR2GZN6_9EUKA